MGKRKASIFTVAEAVNNWFDAILPTPTITEPIEATANSTDAVGEVGATTKQYQLPTVRAEAGHPSSIRPSWTADPPSRSTAPPASTSSSDVACPPRIDEAASKDRPLPADLDPEREAALRTF